MTAKPAPPGLTEADFERIEDAVMETERGRWFLAEYARRIREESADELARSLARIEETLRWAEIGVAAETARRDAARAQVIAERLQDLLWRLEEARAENLGTAVRAEIAAIRALMSPLAPALDRPPPGPGAGAPQGERGLSGRLLAIERLAQDAIESQRLSGPAGAATPSRASARAPEDRRHEAFAAIEALAPHDKLKFFS